jgi:hypothetical protein
MVVFAFVVSICSAYAQIPYSWQPYLEFGSSPAYQSVVSNSVIQQVAWVSDKDTYQDADLKFVQIENSAVAIVAVINSGSVLGVNQQYTGGKRTYTFVIKGKAVVAPTIFIDLFTAADNGGPPIVKDANSPQWANVVEITPPAPPGPPGGGGE